MPDNNPAEDDSQRGVSTKAVELAVAVAILVLGLVVIMDSRRVGAGWADDGPQAGYFPFYIGIILCFASAWTLWRTLFSGKGTTGVETEVWVKLGVALDVDVRVTVELIVTLLAAVWVRLGVAVNVAEL